MAEYKTRVNDAKRGYVEELIQRFSGVNDYFFTNYRGLTVEQITELRSKLREKGAEYRVVKNNFAKIAFREMDHDGLDEYLVGPTAVVLTRDESGPAAKVILDFEKDTPVEVKGGLVNGNVYDKNQVVEYSKLPTRDELIAMLMSTMNAPLQNLVYVLNGVPQKLVRTLQAVADKKAEN
ncbi:MAG: 50S ribosomal protein L10 [Spirochaetia bacterium]